MGLTRCYKTAVFLNVYLQVFYQIFVSFLFWHQFADCGQAVRTSLVREPDFYVHMPIRLLSGVGRCIYFRNGVTELPVSGLMTSLI